MTENEYSPECENVKSSGMANFRLSKVPIGAKMENTESSSLGLALSSKPSHKNNNLSKKEIFVMRPKQNLSLMVQDGRNRPSLPVSRH